MPIKRNIIICLSILFCFPVFGQDTSKTLKPVPVFAKADSILRIAVITSSIPHFEINSAKTDELGATDVGDALKFMPGVQMRDYGGIGGIKTISFRSLGAGHTAVLVDGNKVPNLRSGTMNLSTFELFGLEKLSFSSGRTVDERSSASAYVQANTVALNSILFSKPQQIGLGLYSNSTTINAFEKGLYLRSPLGKNFFIGGQGLVRFGSGEYDFIHPEDVNGPVQTRENAALFDYRVRLVGGFDNGTSRLILSANHKNNEQELPGAAVLFNPSNDQKLWNEQTRVGLNHSWRKKKWGMYNHLNYQNTKSRYYDPHYLNLQGFIDAQYRQHTTTGGFLVRREFNYPGQTIFIGSDLITGILEGNNFRSRPSRYSSISVIGGSTLIGRFRLETNLSAQLIRDNFEDGEQTGSRDFFRLSPFVSIGYLPFDKVALRIRAFYKRTFRMPTFNDMYYNFIGNVDLKPEDADLFNLGITYGIKRKKLVVEFTGDAYYNQVDNKIVAIPTKDLFNWSIQNIGKTEIKGIDLGFIAAYALNKLKFDLSTNLSFNESIDITDPDGITYGHQIPYTPYYTSTHGVGLEYLGFKISSNVLISGFRFSLNENIYANYLPGFIDLNIGLSKQFVWKESHVLIDLKMMNILDKNYQVIRSFPMPGRYFQLRLKYNFKK